MPLVPGHWGLVTHQQTPGLLQQDYCIQTTHWECSSKHPISWFFLYTHTQTKLAYLSILVVTDKSSTWKHVNILMIGSHSKSSNMDFDQKNMTNTIIESILKKKKKIHIHTPLQWPQASLVQLWGSFQVTVEHQWSSNESHNVKFTSISIQYDPFFRWLHWAEEKSFVRM